MTEKDVFFRSKDLQIYGRLHNAEGNRAVVITHPHPLYGGNMYNNVVESVTKAYQQGGFSTLRFNFRGTDGSDGNYDQGVGEREDVKAALLYLNQMGKKSIDLVGYSFGAWVNAMGLKNYDLAERIVFISPPVAFLDFSCLQYSPKIHLVITASEDNYAPPEKIKHMIPTWNPKAEFRVIQDADHFFGTGTNTIETIIMDFLSTTETQGISRIP